MTGAPLLWAALGCAGDAWPPEVRAVDLDPGTAARTGGDVFERWAQGGFVRVAPPIHLPQPAEGEVAVWLRLPDAGALELVDAPDGRRVLSYPPGAEADRVETIGSGPTERVVDVRGTRIDEHGRRWHHVYRALPDRDAPLVGAEWPAGDAELHEIAVDLVMSRLAAAGVGHLEPIRAKLDCDGCHQILRAENRTVDEHGLVARGTDAAGWFTPSSTLGVAGPVERYGRRDPNAADPYVTVSCSTGAPERRTCPGGEVPRGRLDLPAALAAGDPHAAAVCDTWRALAARLVDPPEHPCAEVQP